MKLPDLLDASGSDALGTTPGPGQGQARDARLDGEVALVTHQLDPVDETVGSISAAQAVDDVAAMMADQRQARASAAPCATCGGSGWIPDPMRGRFDLLGSVVCPGCGGMRASSR